MKRALAVLLFALFSGATCVADMLDQHARATDLPAPTYPEADKKQGRGGLVSIVVRVDENGAAKVERVMGTWHSLIVAAKAASAKWKFVAGRRDGKAFGELLEFIVVFDAKKGIEILGPLYFG